MSGRPEVVKDEERIEQKAAGAAPPQRASIQSSILDALPMPVALLDAHGVILFVNEAWRRFPARRGLKNDAPAVGQSYPEICAMAEGYCGREAPQAAAGIRAVLTRESDGFQLDYQCESTTGERWFQMRVEPLETAGARQAVVIHSEITERKEMQAALDAGALRHRALFENMLEGCCYCRLVYEEGKPRDYIYLAVNNAFETQTGLKDVTGKKVSEVVPGMHEANPEQLVIFARVASTGKPEQFETYAKLLGIWFSLSVYSHEKGQFIAVFENITQRKHTEARLRRLVDSDMQGVFFWNKRGEITDANDAFLKLAGYTREDLMAGRISWSAMTPPEYADLDRIALRQVAETGVCATYEKEFIRKDGERLPIMLGAATFQDYPDEGVCVVLDLTDRKRLEQQMLRSQRMESIGTLAGGIAHDLNNMLGPIIMTMDLFMHRFPDPESHELIEGVLSCAQRAAQMVRQVLSFASGAEGQRVEVRLQGAIGEVKKLADDTFLKHIRVHTIVANDLWPVLGDSTQIYQLLLILCLNARDAMPNGGTLTICAENVPAVEKIPPGGQNVGLDPGAHTGPHIAICVKDTGTGMQPKIMDRIFEPFFTTRELGKGTGLGLATALAIVKGHRGFIGFDSEPAKGSTFRVYIPALDGAPAESAPAPDVEMPRGNGEMILVVDDELPVLLATQQALEAFGYRVAVAAGGAEAIKVFTDMRSEIAAILTDMMMPRMDGPTMIQVLRYIDPALPIIAASGFSTEQQVAKAASLGVKHFLPKPCSIGTLLRTLKQVLPDSPLPRG